MENKISCDICMDLMPLVTDGVASDESRKAVEEHIKECAECAAVFSGIVPAPQKEDVLLKKLRSRTRLGLALLLMFGIFFGINLTKGVDVFANSFIMPLLGILGYMIFRWSALYMMPVLLYIASAASFLIGMAGGHGAADSASLISWAGIYSVFAAAGVLTAGLMHFAFRKEEKDEEKDT